MPGTGPFQSHDHTSIAPHLQVITRQACETTACWCSQQGPDDEPNQSQGYINLNVCANRFISPSVLIGKSRLIDSKVIYPEPY